jgi:uncharacterized membrane protein YkvA (DUF1232 family)
MKTQFQWQFLQQVYRRGIRHPRYRWLIVLGTLFYLANPLDIAPDAIPILGWIDDGVVATLLVTEVSQVLLAQLAARKQAKQLTRSNVLINSDLGAKGTASAISVG